MAYREEIKFFSKTFYVILGVVVAVSFFFQPGQMAVALPVMIIAGLLPLLFGRLLITVSHNTIRIRFGYTGLIGKDIPLQEIREARVVEYRPLRQFGGWGIRCGTYEGRKTGCYSMRGNRGVLLILSRNVRVCVAKTDRLIIGSHAPERLKSALGM